MISIIILVKNGEETIAKTLASVRDFPEVIIFDTGSRDATLEIARAYPNVKILERPFQGFGPSRNEASTFASYDWILSIDSDEQLSPQLSLEIRSLSLHEDSVYSLRRHNFFNGKHIKWCGGWHPDIVTRLYHRKKTRFSDEIVHEKVLVSHLRNKTLAHPLYHTPYRQISDFLSKMQIYTTLFAEEKSSSSSLPRALVHSWFAFFKSYILKRGFLGGKEGFIISAYNGHTAFYKYLKLAEKKSDSPNAENKFTF